MPEAQRLAAVAAFACACLLVALVGLGRDGTVRGAVAAPRLSIDDSAWVAPEARKRCDWIAEATAARDRDSAPAALKKKYSTVAADPNAFYRGTAHLFWHDFVARKWGDFNLFVLSGTLADGSPLQRTSTWTWITGDQHLSNFGAWMARDGKVVLGVNDFDEAAIYDFQIDVWRVAVSIYNHALTNGLGSAKAEAAVLTFTEQYVHTAMKYVGNEEALTFECTSSTTTKGTKLHAFLSALEKRKITHAAEKFTHRVDGQLRLEKTADNDLEEVDAATKADIVAAFTESGYGATLLKVGWRAPVWDDASFEVLDVAKRVNSGVGSFGVDRYYVLLAGGESLLPDDDDDDDGSESDDAPPDAPRLRRGVILDVKFEPSPAVRAAFRDGHNALADGDLSWYDAKFPNEAKRAVIAQRKLTSFTDFYAGWVKIRGQDFVVRERSPYKAEFDLDKLDDFEDFAEYIEAIAEVTATAHVRGSVGNSPATFKEVIAAVLGTPYSRQTWGVSVSRVAMAYREQVILDYECFVEYANASVGI